MNDFKEVIVDSPIGRQPLDSLGSPIGAVRMDPDQSYTGISGLLQQYINDSDQKAWEKIKAKIDYTFKNLDFALTALDQETGFGSAVKSRIMGGQKLLFKPNLVNPLNIDPQTHGPDMGSTACTEWAFVAALMRWFHDRLDICYYQMALGEAATCMPAAAALYSRVNPEGKTVTPEAIIEGKAGGFYGGWGFYFARKYLKELLTPDSSDDPMNGHKEGVAGIYISPGLAGKKLLVYDLNRIFDDPAKGREVEVSDGINFKSIILHKAVVGGDPKNPEDLKAYPGCVLVNVPKLKVHAIALFTNVIKNLGIGLYPMQTCRAGQCQWDYATPHNPIPGMKGMIPHETWVGEIDPETGFPPRDEVGRFILKKTGGIAATMIDIIQAVRSQGIYMVHVVDAIEAINLDHQGVLPGKKEPEGMVFAGLDPVGTDLACARYLFSNVPLKEALEGELDDRAGGKFPQRVPVPVVEGPHINTRQEYDCPLSRDHSLEAAEIRGLGRRVYYVVGQDTLTKASLASLQGHLGSIKDNVFSDLVTKKLYFDVFKFPWDMQKVFLNYLAAVDKLTGSSRQKEFLEAFDENGDGVVSYEEFGKKWVWGFNLNAGSHFLSEMGREKFGYIRGFFTMRASTLKYTEALWNLSDHDFLKEYSYGAAAVVAYRMSLMDFEAPDLFLPALTWGKGKWPSLQMAWFIYLGVTFYGDNFPYGIRVPSLYTAAFHYADMTQNGGFSTGQSFSRPNTERVQAYISNVAAGKEKPLDFIFYVPPGYDRLGGAAVPNVESTTDAVKILTAAFNGGSEIWARI